MCRKRSEPTIWHCLRKLPVLLPECHSSFFDGFRTSHEVSKIFRISDEQIREMLDQNLILAHRARRMAPENPFARGVIYDSDVYFQSAKPPIHFISVCKDMQTCMESLPH